MPRKKTKKLTLKTARHIKGRINWQNTENMLPVYIAVKEYPFHAKVLAEQYGLSVAAVYYRLKQHGVSLTDLRNAKTGLGKEILDRYTAKNVSAKVHADMDAVHTANFVTKGIKNGKRRNEAAS